ncbi:hypothetical protein [Paracoccus sp. (in: a-proteobacteria)]|uniref:hypothetical protein n=1 Tax=Paracoccus sp. TaxID=267 RepID=UPI0028A8365D|nr:hypothetical protein [Paracoccus sp. (in: a-proteobacteria)]
MTHWLVSSAIGFLLTGRWQPLCSIIYAAPESRARGWFLRAMDMAFSERDHCRRIYLTHQIGRAFRG